MFEQFPPAKQPVLLSDLSQFNILDKVIIESLEQALYRVEIEVEGNVYYVIEARGKSLTRRSILEIQALLTPYTIGKMFLRQTSAYDEMIGLESTDDSNELLVPLGNYFEHIPDVTRH
ncbi:MAG: DUF6482 family protein [Cellvibrionaceae bacterium]